MNKTLIAVIVRGHERKTFLTKTFANFVKNLGHVFDVHLYVHTWAESEAKMSHRPLNRSGVRPIAHSDVSDYFKSCGVPVKWIRVDADEGISLVGNTSGRIGGIPLRAWKNMWYGKYSAMSAINESGVPYSAVMSVRIDVFLNLESRSYCFINQNKMTDMIRMAVSTGDIVFPTENSQTPGVDNCYVGPCDKMTALVSRFHFEMDDIKSKYPHIKHQEFLVPYESALLKRPGDKIL